MNYRLVTFMALGVVLCILEFLAYYIGFPFSFIASRIWIIMGGIYLLFSLYYILTTYGNDLRKGYFEGIFAIILIIFIVIVGALPHYAVNHEATQEAAAAFQNMQTRDLNYTKFSFIGYPSRQYLLPLIPTVLFGRSSFNLNLGYALPFLLGSMLFYVGLRKYFNQKNSIPLLSLSVISLLTFSYVVEYLWHFEQVILPLSFFLQAVGWFMICRKRVTIMNCISLIWIGSLLATSYTPSLSAWILVIGMIFYSSVREKILSKKYIWLMSLLFIASFGILSFITRTDLRIVSSTNKMNLTESFANLINGLQLFFFSKGRVYISPLISTVVLFYLIFALTFRFGLKHLIIAVWIVGTVIMSVFFNGYATPPFDVALQRSIITIPMILLGILTVILNKFEPFVCSVSRFVWTMLIIIFTGYV